MDQRKLIRLLRIMMLLTSGKNKTIEEIAMQLSLIVRVLIRTTLVCSYDWVGRFLIGLLDKEVEIVKPMKLRSISEK